MSEPTDDEIREMMRTPIYDFYPKYGVLSSEAFFMFEERWKKLADERRKRLKADSAS